MKRHYFWKAAFMLTASALLIALLMWIGLLSYIFVSLRLDDRQTIPTSQISAMLVNVQGIYQFEGEDILKESDMWAMLIGFDGQVKWSCQKPQDVPDAYTLTDVASFTRWYLEDYPVQSAIREDGLLVTGLPKGSMWKHDMTFTLDSLLLLPWWALGTFLLTLGSVLALSARILRRWFKQEQQVRDAARSDWINGVSHDIRTPLSLVMGCASQLEHDPSLDMAQHQRAAIIRSQSQTIRDLVNDLNLTMRLDCAMQPLRCETIQLAAFLRQVVADFINGGLSQGYPVELELPSQTFPPLEADSFLLRRAINNLLINCVRHNVPGCLIRVGGTVDDAWCILFVESDHPAQRSNESGAGICPADGGAAHGTGLKLVQQIALAHGGSARFYSGQCFRCELRLPLSKKKK